MHPTALGAYWDAGPGTGRDGVLGDILAQSVTPEDGKAKPRRPGRDEVPASAWCLVSWRHPRGQGAHRVHGWGGRWGARGVWRRAWGRGCRDTPEAGRACVAPVGGRCGDTAGKHRDTLGRGARVGGGRGDMGGVEHAWSRGRARGGEQAPGPRRGCSTRGRGGARGAGTRVGLGGPAGARGRVGGGGGARCARGAARAAIGCGELMSRRVSL